MKKNLDIEVIRAYAITITIIAHLGLLNPTWDSWIGYFWLGGGVDLFFCISGFLITSSLLTSLTHKEPFALYAGEFWIRRLFRLWPAALLWATITLLISETFNVSRTFGSQEDVRLTWLFGILNVENLYIWISHETSKPTPIWHYWSLSLEEQFYVLLPILLFFAQCRKYVIALMACFALYQSFHIRPWGELLWFIRSDALIYGSLIAAAWHYKHDLISKFFNHGKKLHWQVVFIIALPMPVILSKMSITPYYMGLVAASAAIVVFLCSAGKNLTGNSGLFRSVLIYIGSRSYSIYLTHFPILAITREISLSFGISALETESSRIVATAVAMAFTLLLSEISFRYVETPLRNYGRRSSRRWTEERRANALASGAL
ncbi:acyltransferase family protein [Pseudomonas sp. NPDC086278]|uniref:acyltransferase family protein n=1 Tax=Pseudomonas sp. NPDC086278 TaxID=3390646 RepID=UPI003D059EFA